MAAAASLATVVVVLLLAVVMAAGAAMAADETTTTTHINLFMHNVLAGSDPTAVRVVSGPGSFAAPNFGMSFGDMLVIDDALTETSSSDSVTLGRLEGFYMVSSKSGARLTVCNSLVFTAGDYSGSTLYVMGRLDDTPAALAAAEPTTVRELAVVGGTGKFRMATGYVLWTLTRMDRPDATIELDIYVSTAKRTTIAAAAA